MTSHNELLNTIDRVLSVMLGNMDMRSNDAVDKFAVSAVNRTLSNEANKLEIFDLTHKLKQPGVYDIGGTYSEEENETKPDLWFFFSTSRCPGNNHLLNLFVCQRKTGGFSIGIRRTPRAKLSLEKKQNLLAENYVWHMFKSTQADENYYLHTYCFNESAYEDIKVRESVVIDLKIEMNAIHTLNNNVITKIKLNHDFAGVLAKQEKADCTVISSTRKRFPAHKVFLAAHSPILKELIISKKPTEAAEVFLDISDSEVKLLLEFIYSGTIRNLQTYDPFKLLQIADNFRLQNLIFLTQYSLCQQINIENAVMLAQISEQYNLTKLQLSVFNYIKYNPKVLESDGWKNLDDVNLAKKLFQHIYTDKTD